MTLVKDILKLGTLFFILWALLLTATAVLAEKKTDPAPQNAGVVPAFES